MSKKSSSSVSKRRKSTAKSATSASPSRAKRRATASGAARKRSKKVAYGLSETFSELARKVVNDSLRIKPGETVTVETWTNGLPFARQVVKEARKIGAIPLMILEDEEAYLDGVRNMPREMLGKLGQHELNLLSGTNAYVFIPGPPIGAYAPMISREDSAAATSYNGSWYEAAEKSRLRGARLTFGYVGRDLAKALGKSEEEIIDHQIRAALVDFEALKAQGNKIADQLADESPAVITSEGGNALNLTLRGDLNIEDGIIDEQDISEGNNMGYIPPGMVAKGVDTSSASGSVRIMPSMSRLGVIPDSTLHFDGGRLVRWESRNLEARERLDSLIGSIPEENRVIRALTVGFNSAVKYGFSHDRFVPGAVSITGFGFTGIVRNGTLEVNGKKLVESGELKAAD